MPGLPRRVRIRYRRPPDALTVYTQTLIHDDGHVKVTFAQGVSLPKPVRVDGRAVLESGSDAVWFTFPGRWFDIGRFHRPDGTFTGLYANIITPCIFDPGGEWDTTDLFLDLWIGAEDASRAAAVIETAAPGRGVSPRLLDVTELAEAVERGDLPERLATRAQAEAVRLLSAARKGAWPPRVVHEWPRASCLKHLG